MRFHEGQRVTLQTKREGTITGTVIDTSFLDHGELFIRGDDGRERFIPVDQIESVQSGKKRGRGRRDVESKFDDDFLDRATSMDPERGIGWRDLEDDL